MIRSLNNYRGILLAILVLTTLLLLAAAAFAWSSRRARNRQRLLDNAAAAEEAGDWTAVETALRRYTQLAGDDAEICQRIGHAIQQGAVSDQDRFRALPFYTKALALSPRCDAVRLQFADLQIEGNPHDAVKHANIVLQQQPASPDALRIKALGLARLTLPRDDAEDRLIETYQALIAALKHQPGDVKLATAAAEFHHRHATPLAAALRINKHDLEFSADAVLAALVDRAEDEAEARLTRLMLRSKLGLASSRDEISREDLERPVILRPASNAVRLLAAGWSARQAFPKTPQSGRSVSPNASASEQARQHLTAAIENRSDDPVPYWSLAQLQWWSDEREAAMATLEMGRESAGQDNLVLNLRLAEAQIALGQWEVARDTLQALDALVSREERQSPADRFDFQPLMGGRSEDADRDIAMRPIIDLLWAQWFLAVDNPAVDPSRALPLLERYIADSSRSGVRGLACYLRGVALASLDRWEDAATVLLRATQVTDTTVLPRLAAAYCLYRVGRYREATTLYRYALSSLEQRPQPTLNVNQIWIELARCILAEQSQQPIWKRQWRTFDQVMNHLVTRLPNSPIPLFLRLEAGLMREMPDARASALTELKQARERFHDSPEFWQLLAGYCLRAGEPSAATRAIESWERVSGRTAHALRAELALATGNPLEADQLWKTMASTQATHGQRRLLTRRVQSALQLGQTRYAQQLLVDWLTEHPSDRQMLFQLAQVAWTAGNPAALQDAVERLESGADPTDRLLGIARTQALLLACAQEPAAETRSQLQRCSSELAKAHPADRQVAVLEALVAELVDDPRAAVQAWRRAIRLGEQASSSRLRLAALLHDQGKSREALALCLSVVPSVGDCRAARLVARILATTPTDPVAERCAEDLFGRTLAAPDAPDFALFLMELAVLREYQGRADRAVALTERALQLQPQAVELKNNLAWFLTAYQGEHAAAARWVEEAIEAVGPLPTLLDTKGVVLLATGQTEEAIAALEASSDVPSPPAVRLLHLAEAYQQAGRVEDARQSLAQAESLGLTRLTPRDRSTFLKLKVRS